MPTRSHSLARLAARDIVFHIPVSVWPPEIAPQVSQGDGSREVPVPVVSPLYNFGYLFLLYAPRVFAQSLDVIISPTIIRYLSDSRRIFRFIADVSLSRLCCLFERNPLILVIHPSTVAHNANCSKPQNQYIGLPYRTLQKF